jgi:hypothetical protein
MKHRGVVYTEGTSTIEKLRLNNRCEAERIQLKLYNRWCNMNNKKPTPVIQQRGTKECPVCGKPSYSQGGIHPQCAVEQADLPRQKRLAAEKKQKAKIETKTKRKSWN